MEPNAVLNWAVASAILAGVHFVGAAGDFNQDARFYFPAGSECSCLESVNFQGLTLY